MRLFNAEYCGFVQGLILYFIVNPKRQPCFELNSTGQKSPSPAVAYLWPLASSLWHVGDISRLVTAPTAGQKWYNNRNNCESSWKWKYASSINALVWAEDSQWNKLRRRGHTYRRWAIISLILPIHNQVYWKIYKYICCTFSR